MVIQCKQWEAVPMVVTDVRVLTVPDATPEGEAAFYVDALTRDFADAEALPDYVSLGFTI